MTSNLQFHKATKQQARLRMAIDGPSGAGKTYTGLLFAFELAKATNSRVAVIDTEHASASKYADLFPEFDVLELTTFSPEVYTEAIKLAEKAGYGVLLIDSLSHAWDGVGGALEMVDDVVARSRSGNSYTAWRDVTPLHRQMIEAILQSGCHIIATMRSKMEYVIEKDNQGKTEIRKVGLAPIQRQGMEYEFDVVADMDVAHRLVVSKSRCSTVADAVALKPKGEWMQPVIAWLTSGAAVKAAVTLTEQAPAQVQAEPEQSELERKAPPRTRQEQAESTAETKAHWSIDRNGTWRGFISQAATYRGFDMTDETYHGMLKEQWGVEHTAQLPNDYAACQKAALAWMNSKAGVPAGKN